MMIVIQKIASGKIHKIICCKIMHKEYVDILMYKQVKHRIKIVSTKD